MMNYSSTMGRHFESTMKSYAAMIYARTEVKADRLAEKILGMTKETDEFKAAMAEFIALDNKLGQLRDRFAKDH